MRGRGEFIVLVRKMKRNTTSAVTLVTTIKQSSNIARIFRRMIVSIDPRLRDSIYNKYYLLKYIFALIEQQGDINEWDIKTQRTNEQMIRLGKM